jgi:osmoprotectant transport system permease protein
MNLRTESCLQANTWTCTKFFSARSHEVRNAIFQHLQLTVLTIIIAFAISLPLALLVRRSNRASEALLGVSSAIYTIPSLALFGILVPITGLYEKTVIIGLVLYSLTVLIRNVLAGLDGVPEDAVDAARGMGMGNTRILVKVELPLAMPTIFAGLRVATVSTVALVTIGYLIGEGGLGNLIDEGFNNDFKAEVFWSSVLCVVIAVALDAALVLIQRLALPWARRAG